VEALRAEHTTPFAAGAPAAASFEARERREPAELGGTLAMDEGGRDVAALRARYATPFQKTPAATVAVQERARGSEPPLVKLPPPGALASTVELDDAEVAALRAEHATPFQSVAGAPRFVPAPPPRPRSSMQLGDTAGIDPEDLAALRAAYATPFEVAARREPP